MVLLSFIKIDLGRVRVVSGVATQGYSFNLWTTQYHLNYSIDGTVWKRYMESGIVKVIILLWKKNPRTLTFVIYLVRQSTCTAGLASFKIIRSTKVV